MIRIKPGGVHLWDIALNHNLQADAQAKLILSTSEWTRVEKLHNPSDSKNYALCYLAVRRIISAYIGVPAEKLQILRTEFDKPYVASKQNNQDIRFSLSHTGNRALLAMSSGFDIGVDLEFRNRAINVTGIAKRYFGTQTQHYLQALSGSAKKLAFLQYWTYFEAYKKARGDGLRGNDSLLDFSDQQHVIAPKKQLKHIGRTWLAMPVKSNPLYVAACCLESDSFNFQVQPFRLAI